MKSLFLSKIKSLFCLSSLYTLYVFSKRSCSVTHERRNAEVAYTEIPSHCPYKTTLRASKEKHYKEKHCKIFIPVVLEEEENESESSQWKKGEAGKHNILINNKGYKASRRQVK